MKKRVNKFIANAIPKEIMGWQRYKTLRRLHITQKSSKNKIIYSKNIKIVQ